MKLAFSQQFFKNYSNTKFHEYQSSGSHVVPWGWTDRWTGMMKLTVTFRNFANAPKNMLQV